MTGLLLVAKKVLHLQTGPNQHKVILKTLRYQTDRWISSVTWKIIMHAVEFAKVHYFSSQTPHQLGYQASRAPLLSNRDLLSNPHIY
jgi:hypothetical protein